MEGRVDGEGKRTVVYARWARRRLFRVTIYPKAADGLEGKDDVRYEG